MLRSILWMCIAVTALTGCGRAAAPDAEKEEIKTVPAVETVSTKETAPIEEIVEKESDLLTVQINEFDLGASEYEAMSGKIMPYRLRGVIGMPEGDGPFPMVLITHGSHSNIEEGLRFDTGYRYLVEALAQNGYVAVSMDMGSAYLWKYGDSDDLEKSVYLADEQIKCLQRADKGEANEYPVDLTGKIDWQHVAIAGHSRGGAAAIQIAQQTKDVKIGAVLAIAPSMSGDMEAIEWPECPISIIVPEYDGDVISLDGFSFDAVLDDKSDQMHAVTYLLKGNHNYFNTNITQNDALLAREESQLADQLMPEIQQKFLAQFAVDYFNAVLKAQPEGTLYTADTVQPDKMYGLDVITRLRLPNAAAVTDIRSQNFEAENLSAKLVADSWFYLDDQVTVDTITFGNDFYKTKPLLDIRWQDTKGVLSFVPKESDFSALQSLILELVVDSADEQNGQGQNFTVELKDAMGNSASVVLQKGLNTLRTTVGKLDHTPIDDKEYSFFTPLTPIGSLRIPLSLFQGVDLKRIEEISLRFDQTKQGSLYLQNLWIQ